MNNHVILVKNADTLTQITNSFLIQISTKLKFVRHFLSLYIFSRWTNVFIIY